MRLVIALHIEKLTDGVHLAAKSIDSQQSTRVPFVAEGDPALARRPTRNTRSAMRNALSA